MRQVKKTITLRSQIGVSGRIKVMVIQGGQVVQEHPWQHNLVLDYGLDRLAVESFEQCMQYCVAGTGSTPTETLSGATTASQTGSTLTASGSIFSAADAGRVIKMASGQVRRIVTYTSPTQVEVTPSGDFGAATFTIYRVEQTGLQTEVRRTANCLNDANGQTFTSGVIRNYRTFDFPAETANVNYSEIGFSDSATVAANLYSRILLTGAVTVMGPQGETPGQSLRVVYEQFVTFAATTATAATWPITGWPTEYSITGITSTPSNFVVTTSVAHHYVAGVPIVISGCSVAAYNGTWTVASVTGTTVTVTSAINPGAASDGTLTNTLDGTYMLTGANINEPYPDGQYSGYPYGEHARAIEPKVNDTTINRCASSFTLPGSIVDGSGPSLGNLQDPQDCSLVGTYVAGTFQKTLEASWPIDDGNGTWYGVSFGGSWYYRFNSPQKKANTHTLTLRFKRSWDRVL